MACPIFATVTDDTLFSQLIQATLSALNPQSTNDSAKSALEFLDSVKSNPSVAYRKIAVSFRLINLSINDLPVSSTQFHSHLRLSGFQLLEYTIKNNWSNLLEAQRNNVTIQLENLIVSSASSLKENYLRDGLARCVTQAALQSWPAKWQSLLPSCLASPCNPCTLYFLWRIAEDVSIFFLPPEPQRRRDILNKLKSELPSILQYISTCLQSADQPDLCLVALRTLTTYLDWNTVDEGILTFLFTLLSFPMNHGGQSVDFWLQAKCISCDCLMSIYSKKKPKPDEAEILTNALRKTDSLSSVINVSKFLRDILSEDKFDCTFFDLGKKCCSLITKLARFILNHDKFYMFDVKCVRQQSEKLNEAKPLEEAMLTELLEIYSHPCQPLSYVTFEFWKDFWRDKAPLVTQENTAEIDPLPTAIHDSIHFMAQSILSTFPRQIIKRDSSSEIILYAFDSGEYDEAFYPKYKHELIDILRVITLPFESLVMNFTLQLFNSLLNDCVSQLELLAKEPAMKPNFSNWDILALILDAVCVKLCTSSKFLPQVQLCLESLLSQSNELMASPLLLSHQLSCISSLVPFLPKLSTSFTERIVDRMLLLAQYKLDESSDFSHPGRLEIISLHGHACNAFVKLARRVPSLLVPYFNRIRDQIYNGKFSRLKLEVLNEGLILISNKFNSEDDQKMFILHIMQQLNWLGNFNMDLVTFTQFMGLTESSNVLAQILTNMPSSTSSDAGTASQMTPHQMSSSPEVAIFHENRTTVLYNINLAMALMKRVEKKSILLPELKSFLGSILLIIEHLNSMWLPDFIAGGYIKCPELLSKLYAPATDVDKSHLLEYHLQGVESRKLSPHSRLQSFLWSLHETLYSFLGISCNTLSPEIYSELQRMLRLLSTVVHLPAMKLKMVLKLFIRPLLVNFPIDNTLYSFESLDGIMTQFLPWLYTQIDEKWKILRVTNASIAPRSIERQSTVKGTTTNPLSMCNVSNLIDPFSSVTCVTSSSGESRCSRSRSGLPTNATNDCTDGGGGIVGCNVTCDSSATQTSAQLEAELIDDQSNRLLSREFVDLLMACFFAVPTWRKGQQINFQSTLNDDTSQGFNEMDMDTFDAAASTDVTGKTACLSDLGRNICTHHRATLVQMVTGMLRWLDSVTVNKTCVLMKHLLKDLIDNKCIKSKSDVDYLVENLYTALRYIDVDADATIAMVISLLFSLYEAVCIMEYEEGAGEAMKDIFWLSSSTNRNDWDAFESVYVKPIVRGEGKVNEKKKKEAFKNLLINIISVNST